jgi:uncharacterized protein (DUF433 family)
MQPAIIDRRRGPEIAGTRITVFDVLDHAQAGWHHTAIAAQFGISSHEVLAALHYVDDHNAEGMAEYQKILERAARGNPPEVQKRQDADHAGFLDRVRQWRQANGQAAKSAGNPGGQ